MLDDANKALRHKLLAVPAFKTRYLTYVGDIADAGLPASWSDSRARSEADRRRRGAGHAPARRDRGVYDGVYGPGDGAPPAATTIKSFADQRRAALLAHPEVVKARAK